KPSDPEYQRIQRDAASAFGDDDAGDPPAPKGTSSARSTHPSARRPSGGADIGNHVVAELQRRRRSLPTDDLAAADQLIGEIQFRRDAGLPAPKRPAPQAGPTGLGDRVVEILRQRHGQAGEA